MSKKKIIGKYCDVCDQISVQPKNCEDFKVLKHTDPQDCIDFLKDLLHSSMHEMHIKNESLAKALFKIQVLEGEFECTCDDDCGDECDTDHKKSDLN